MFPFMEIVDRTRGFDFNKLKLSATSPRRSVAVPATAMDAGREIFEVSCRCWQMDVAAPGDGRTPWKSGGGPPSVLRSSTAEGGQSKTRGVCLPLTNRAKRPGVRQSPGAFGRAEDLERWMIPVRTKSGAETTATSRRSVAKAEVQTLREFRRVAAFGRKPPSEK